MIHGQTRRPFKAKASVYVMGCFFLKLSLNSELRFLGPFYPRHDVVSEQEIWIQEAGAWVCGLRAPRSAVDCQRGGFVSDTLMSVLKGGFKGALQIRKVPNSQL